MLQAQLQPQRAIKASGAGLWSRSSAFRKLAVGACLVMSLAIGAPMLLRPPASCTIQLSNDQSHLAVKVLGISDQGWVQKLIEHVDAQFRARIAPGYEALKWIYFISPGQTTPSGMAAVPGNLAVKAGDVVELNNRYRRDPSLACAYIPWTVNRVLESAAP